MRRSIITLALIAACSALVVGIAAAPARAQTAPAVGAPVKDAKGASIGVIEKVVTDAQGRPRQVQIREGRLLRTLPIDGLKPDGAGFVTVLTKAEFDALPGAE